MKITYFRIKVEKSELETLFSKGKEFFELMKMIKNANLNQRFYKIMRHFQKNSLENIQLLKKSFG